MNDDEMMTSVADDSSANISDLSESNENNENNESSDDSDTSDTSDSSDPSDSSDSSDPSDPSDSSDTSDSSDRLSDDKTSMIGMVMRACVSLIDGRTQDEELRQLLDALKAHERIEELLIELSELRQAHQTEIDTLRNEYESKLEAERAECEQKIAAAHAAGEIAGRNAVITETLTSPEMMETLPRLSGSSNPRQYHPNSIFDLAARAR